MTNPSLRIASGMVLVLSLMTGLLCAAATETDAQKEIPPSDIEIKLETSRPQPIAGTGLGVMADVRNISSKTVYLNQQYLTLVLPPELQGPFTSSYGRWGMFPTEMNGKPGDNWNMWIALKPGDTYRAFWTSLPYNTQNVAAKPSIGKDLRQEISSELHFLFFSPGDYVISVVAKYWSDPGTHPEDYRTTVQSATLHVEAPQFVILFGAAVGGLVAFLILPQARRRVRRSRQHGTSPFFFYAARAGSELLGIGVSILLGSIVTILLSRLSETQLPIRISVTDVWGGMTIGFLATYAGVAYLDKLIPGTRPTDTKTN